MKTITRPAKITRRFPTYQENSIEETNFSFKKQLIMIDDFKIGESKNITLQYTYGLNNNHINVYINTPEVCGTVEQYSVKRTGR